MQTVSATLPCMRGARGSHRLGAGHTVWPRTLTDITVPVATWQSLMRVRGYFLYTFYTLLLYPTTLYKICNQCHGPLHALREGCGGWFKVVCGRTP